MPTLTEIMNEVEAGFYTVPEIQRRFVWKNPQIRDLALSIYNNHPIGAIVFWNLQAKMMKDESLRDLFRPLADGLPLENGRYAIIDGQQRLTSLLLIKRGEISTSGKKRKIKLYFNPIDERFELGSRDIEKDSARAMPIEETPIEFYLPTSADIIVMNPPYVRQESIPKHKKEKYVADYGLDRTSDLYAYFIVRAIKLLKDDGVASLITSDKWLEVSYGETLQNMLKLYIVAVYGQRRRSFTADVNTIITVLKKSCLEKLARSNFLYLSKTMLETNL